MILSDDELRYFAELVRATMHRRLESADKWAERSDGATMEAACRRLAAMEAACRRLAAKDEALLDRITRAMGGKRMVWGIDWTPNGAEFTRRKPGHGG